MAACPSSEQLQHPPPPPNTIAARLSLSTSSQQAALAKSTAIQNLKPTTTTHITTIMSLRFVPAKPHTSQTVPETSAPSAPGLHDTLRSRLSLTTPVTNSSTAPLPLQSTHPLEARLSQWRTTQDNIKMEMLRRQFGIAEPVKRQMERKITGAGEWRPAILGGSTGVHRDVLEGRDCEVEWEDVFVGNELRQVPDFHTEMEAKMKMNW